MFRVVFHLEQMCQTFNVIFILSPFFLDVTIVIMLCSLNFTSWRLHYVHKLDKHEYWI